jgi:RNA polymerase sigma-70 factor (ECF subfamily)
MGDAGDWRPERYRPLLHLLVRLMQLDPRFGRRFDSSDLAQETLLKAHKNRDQFQGMTEAELVRWLQGILTNVVTDKVREATAGKRNLRLEQSLQAAVTDSSTRLERFLGSHDPSPGQQAERRELLLRLTEAVDRLPDDQREVIVRRDLGGEPISQIAGELRRTEKSVAGLLLRGRRRLRELLAGLE